MSFALSPSAGPMATLSTCGPRQSAALGQRQRSKRMLPSEKRSLRYRSHARKLSDDVTTRFQCLRLASARNGLAGRWIFAVMSASWWARGLQGQPIGVLTAWNGIVTALRACGPPSVAKGMTKISYNGYRFPSEIIEQAIWLYLRFTLSFRDVEDLLAEPGISTSSSTTDRPISSPNALTPASTPASWWRRT